MKVCNKARTQAMKYDPGRNKHALSRSAESIAVVIPCHNYAHYLDDCLQSVVSQSVLPKQIIVVNDSSTDDPKSVCEKYPTVQYERCEVRDVHQTRNHGLQLVSSDMVMFLDADDKIPETYIQDAMAVLRQDRRVVIAYPRLEYFGDASGPAHGTEHSPPEIVADDIERRNYIPAGSVFRTKILHQSLAFSRKIDPVKNWSQDWLVSKAVLQSGNWLARKMSIPLMYRKHGGNMSSRPNDSYWDDADLANETVTVVLAFSGRWDAWPKLRSWIDAQTWPVEQVRLLIMNSTHAPLTTSMLGLSDWPGSIQVERMDAGYPRLADEDRRDAPHITSAVEAAVAGLYNRAITLLGTEYVVFIEDDVIPHDADLIEKFFRTMGPCVAGISGVYRQRYQTDKCCAFTLPYVAVTSFRPLEGSGIETIGGSGFGCLMTRRSLLRRFPLSGETQGGYYDCNFCQQIANADNDSWRWILNRDIQADHMI